MTNTGIFLSQLEYKSVADLIENKITVNLQKGQNIYETRKQSATTRLQELALSKGLPALEGSKSYGLSSNRGIVAP